MIFTFTRGTLVTEFTYDAASVLLVLFVFTPPYKGYQGYLFINYTELWRVLKINPAEGDGLAAGRQDNECKIKMSNHSQAYFNVTQTRPFFFPFCNITIARLLYFWGPHYLLFTKWKKKHCTTHSIHTIHAWSIKINQF